MTLLDYFIKNGAENGYITYDVCDSKFDYILNFDMDNNTLHSSDLYEKFVVELAKKIPFIKEVNGMADIIGDFTKFIETNIYKIRAYILLEWNEEFLYVLDDGNEDDLIYEFIDYLNSGLMGSYGDNTYKGLIKLLKSCK